MNHKFGTESFCIRRNLGIFTRRGNGARRGGDQGRGGGNRVVSVSVWERGGGKGGTTWGFVHKGEPIHTVKQIDGVYVIAAIDSAGAETSEKA